MNFKKMAFSTRGVLAPNLSPLRICMSPDQHGMQQIHETRRYKVSARFFSFFALVKNYGQKRNIFLKKWKKMAVFGHFLTPNGSQGRNIWNFKKNQPILYSAESREPATCHVGLVTCISWEEIDLAQRPPAWKMPFFKIRQIPIKTCVYR